MERVNMRMHPLKVIYLDISKTLDKEQITLNEIQKKRKRNEKLEKGETQALRKR
jgi:heme exporter protein D